MPDLYLPRPQRRFLLCVGLVLATVICWGSLAYVAWSARQQVSTLVEERDKLIAERNEVLAKHKQLQRSAGDLRQVEAKLNAARAEHRRVLELTESQAQLAATKEQMTGLIKRVEQAKDPERVSQTGSIRKGEKPTAR
jgi:uncharacterized protein (DUF3084 family)